MWQSARELTGRGRRIQKRQRGEPHYQTEIARLQANQAFARGDTEEGWRIIRESEGELQALDQNGNAVQDPNEPTVTAEVTIYSPVDNTRPGGDSGIEIIVWDEIWWPSTSMYGHVSYVIDGVSWSFDNTDYHRRNPDDYINYRRSISGATGYVLDFGSEDLNKRFKDAIVNAYKDNKKYSVTSNNCASAFARAINSIAGDLGVPLNNNIKPKSHGAYIQNHLKPYIKAINTYTYQKGASNSKK